MSFRSLRDHISCAAVGSERRRYAIKGLTTTTNEIEERVVSAATAGDEAAYAQLVERYRGELQVHAYRMLGSLEDAQDALQEAFLRAWIRRATYRGQSTFRAWLYRITTNACLRLLERRPRRVVPFDTGPSAELGARPQPPADLPGCSRTLTSCSTRAWSPETPSSRGRRSSSRSLPRSSTFHRASARS